MRKLPWLLLSIVTSVLLALPAYAGRLLSWRFDPTQNRLVFTTDDGVQPRAQLISNPTRLVIDLPGTVLGKPSVSQSYSGQVSSVRVGQFDSGTTRLVIEVIPGYTLDPNGIKIRGLSPTQWTVDLPQAQRITDSPPPSINNPSSSGNNPPPPRLNSSQKPNTSDDVRVTMNGLIVRMDISNAKSQDIQVQRSGETIEFTLKGVVLPPSLISRGSVNVNEYGVSKMEFTQVSNSPAVAKVRLYVQKDSPNWEATYSRTVGLVLWPVGGNVSRSVTPRPLITSRPQSNITTIQSIQLTDNDSQLLVQGDQRIKAQGRWVSPVLYEIKIDNAKLDDNFIAPELQANSRITRLRIPPQNSNTVVIQIQPDLGIKLGQLKFLGDNSLALQLAASNSSFATPTISSGSNQSPITIYTPPPNTRPFPPTSSNNPYVPPRTQYNPPPANTPKGRRIVVIDPGHGGKDPGAVGINGLQEKQVIFPIAQQVAEILESQGITVIMTRTSDYFVTLEGRTNLANSRRADVFVSIHANSAGSSRPDVSGLETYYHESGLELARTVHNAILRRVDVKDRRVRKARFFVLRKSNMPSILIETGFVTGSEDAAKLSNPNYRSQMAQAIASGIIEYIKQNNL